MTNGVFPRTGLRITIAATAISLGLSAAPAPADHVVLVGQQIADGLVDRGHAGASDRVRRLGAWLDRFFGDENYEAEVNESQIRLRLESFSQLYEGTEADAKARLRLKLPALNDRLRLDILSPGESDDLEASDSGDVGPPPPGAEEENASASVSYFLRAVKDRSVIARVGLKFDGFDPNPFVGVRYRELLPMGEDWNLRFTQRFRFFRIDGLESRTTFDLERIVEKDTLLRTSVNGTWLQEDPDYFYSVGFALIEPIDEKSAAQFQVVSDFRTDPHRLDRITVRVRHRQKIWRDWLIFEVAPQVAFPDERDFDAVPGILFSIEATFGG